MSDVVLDGIAKSFGGTEVIRPLDLAVEAGEFIVFVGPSGCGKSTLLRLIAGLETPSRGRVVIGGRDVTRAEPSERGVAMVFQTYALYPHMTVAENMSFGLEMARVAKVERDEAVRRAARTLRIEDYLDRKPRTLSGGQRQRVAIGRAIVRDPKVFLFDEPLSNLDAELRVQMRLELARLHAELGATMIYVTHDQTEAMTLADRIVILRAGRIEQTGTPEALYADPDDVFVAGFIGSPRMNLLPARAVGRTSDGRIAVDVPRLGVRGLAVRPRGAPRDVPEEVVLGIRPEDLAGAGEGADVSLRAEVVENLGGSAFLYSETGREDAVVAQLPRGRLPRAGEAVSFRVPSDACFLFGPDGRRL